jgi:hypothetical protein
MAGKAKGDRLEALHSAHLKIQDNLVNRVYPLIEKIEAENDFDLQREGRVTIGRHMGYLDGNATYAAIYASSHDEINEIRARDKELRVSVFKADKVASEAHDKFTRELHAHFELDNTRQERLHNQIGLTDAREEAQRLGAEDSKLLDQIRAYKPQTASALRRKVEIIRSYLDADHLEADSALFEILKGDISRLFPASKPKNRRSA